MEPLNDLKPEEKELVVFIEQEIEKVSAKIKIQQIKDKIIQLSLLKNRKNFKQWNNQFQKFITKYFTKAQRAKLRETIPKEVESKMKQYPQVVKDYNLITSKSINVVQIKDLYLDDSEQKRRLSIKKNIESSQSIQEFLSKQLDYIIDIIHRKVDFCGYYELLVQQANISKEAFISSFKSMTLVDFSILLMKITFPDHTIPILLSQLGAPVPISYSTTKDILKNQSLIKDILGLGSYPLIINIWSEKAINSLKNLKTINQFKQTLYYSQLTNTNPKYFEGSNFQGNINLFKLSFRDKSDKQQTIIMVDLVDKMQEDQINFLTKKSLVQNLLGITSLVVFHMDQELKPNQKQQTFMKHYQFVLDHSIPKVFIAELINNSDESKNNFLQSLQKHYPIGQKNFFYFELRTELIDIGNQQQFKQMETSFSNLLMEITKFQARAQSFFKQKYQAEESKSLKTQIQSFLQRKLKESKQVLLPKNYLSRKLNEVKRQIKKIQISAFNTFDEKKREQIDNKFKSLEQKQATLKRQLKKNNLSDFVRDCVPFITKDYQKFRSFTEILVEQTNKKVFAQLKKKDISKKGQQYQLVIQTNRITIDNIIQQLSIYNQLNIDRKAEILNSPQQQIIDQYYSKCLDKLIPFNLIDGQTSNFGNESLQRFFQKLNRESNRQKFYVISLIGAKSSGKSTLINYLFRYNIHLKEDIYAKGVYFGKCSISNKTIIVLDSQGIMNIDYSLALLEQYKFDQIGKIFATFDHQIASILMKQSDLVIISNKAQKQNNTLKISQQYALILGICFKVLDAFYTNNVQQIIVPKNVMLVFSNQSDIIINKPQMIDQLVKRLSPILKLSFDSPDYKPKNQQQQYRNIFNKYIRLSEKNIIFLPKAYTFSQEKPSFKLNSDQYGKGILELRKKITDNLQYYIPPKTLVEFYGDSKVDWSIILLTAGKIVLAQTINQSSVKSQFEYAYQKAYPEMIQQIKNQLQALMKQNKLQIQSTVLKAQLNKDKNKKSKWTYFNENILDKFRSNLQSYQTETSNIKDTVFKKFKDIAIGIFGKVQWINQYKSQVAQLIDQALFKQIKIAYQNFEKTYQQAVLNQFSDELLETIRVKVQQKKQNETKVQRGQYMKRREQRLKKYNQKAELILAQRLHTTVDKNSIKNNLNKTFEMIFNSNTIFLRQLQIKHINDCLDFQNEIGSRLIQELKKLIDFADQSQVPQKNKGEIVKIIEQSLKKFQEKLNWHIGSQLKPQVDLPILFNYIRDNFISEQTKQTRQMIKNKSSQVYENILKDQIYKKKIIEKIQTQQEQSYYYTQIFAKSQDRSQKIMLNVINYKILLLAKLYDILYKSSYKHQLQQIKNAKQLFQQRIKKIRKDNLQIVEAQFQKQIKQAIKDRIKQFVLQQFKARFKQFYKQKVKKFKYNQSSLIQLQRVVLNKTLFNPSIPPKQTKANNDNQTLLKTEKTELEKIYVQCYKFICNPIFYTLQQARNTICSISTIRADRIAVLKMTEAKIDKDLTFLNLDQTETFVQKQFPLAYNFYTFGVFDIQDILKVIKNMIKQQFNYQQFDKQEKIKKDAQEVVLYVMSQRDIVGCHSCCSFCGAKCYRSKYHSGYHLTLNHTIVAFGGVRNQKNQFMLNNCLSPQLKNQYWNDSSFSRDFKNFISTKNYFWKNHYENYNQKNYSNRERSINIWKNIEDQIIKTWGTAYYYSPKIPEKAKDSKENKDKPYEIIDISQQQFAKVNEYWKQ